LTPAWGCRTGPQGYIYRLAGRYDNYMPESTIYPPFRDYEFGYRFKSDVRPHRPTKNLASGLERARREILSVNKHTYFFIRDEESLLFNKSGFYVPLRSKFPLQQRRHLREIFQVTVHDLEPFELGNRLFVLYPIVR
jgi:hypothetical protein